MHRSGASLCAASPSKVISFNGSNGANPYPDLVMDNAGNLFGTTYSGGASSYGTSFELVKDASGSTLNTLVNFDCTNSCGPYAGLITDSVGDLFGTTRTGGANGHGTVFELAKSVVAH